MKSVKKRLSIIVVLLFIMGIIVIAYYLYNAPSGLADSLTIKELSGQTQINKTFRQLNIFVGLEIAFGMLAIVLLLTTQATASQTSNTTTSINQTLSDIYSETENKSEVALSEKISSVEHKLQNHTAANSKQVLEKVLNLICNELEACQGALYVTSQTDSIRTLELTASYAYFFAESKTISYEFGEGLIGQVAKEGKTININAVPEGYITIVSGLGSASPNHLIILPLLFENNVFGVLELASFKKITKSEEHFLNELAPILAKNLSGQWQTITDVK